MPFFLGFSFLDQLLYTYVGTHIRLTGVGLISSVNFLLVFDWHLLSTLQGENGELMMA